MFEKIVSENKAGGVHETAFIPTLKKAVSSFKRTFEAQIGHGKTSPSKANRSLFEMGKLSCFLKNYDGTKMGANAEKAIHYCSKSMDYLVKLENQFS